MSNPAAPPHDLSAEMAVLAAMLESQAVLAEMSRRLTAEKFYRPQHGTLFDAMVTLFGKGVDVNHMSVTSHLADIDELDRVGGVPYIAGLIQHSFAGTAGWHAQVVVDKATEREWAAHATRILRTLAEPGLPTDERTARIVADSETVAAAYNPSRGRWAADIAADTINQMAAMSAGTVDLRLVPTGFSDLDRLLGGGFRGGQFIVVAGRPGMGKSTLAMDFVRNVSIRAGMTSMVASLEMSDTELMMRMVSAESRIPLQLIRTGNLREDEWHRVAEKIAPVDDAKIMVFDDPGMYLPQIRAEARRLRAVHDVRLIVVDYLQLMSSAKRVESRQQEVADLSRGLKLLAKEADCAVVGVSQLNRGPEQRADKRPNLGDLRESGAIEQDADIVILLHRDDAYDRNSERPGEADFIIAKHRNGETDTVTVAAQLHLSRFVDMAVI